MSGATAELVVPTTLLPEYDGRLVPHRRQAQGREEGRGRGGKAGRARCKGGGVSEVE